MDAATERRVFRGEVFFTSDGSPMWWVTVGSRTGVEEGGREIIRIGDPEHGTQPVVRYEQDTGNWCESRADALADVLARLPGVMEKYLAEQASRYAAAVERLQKSIDAGKAVPA